MAASGLAADEPQAEDRYAAALARDGKRPRRATSRRCLLACAVQVDLPPDVVQQRVIDLSGGQEAGGPGRRALVALRHHPFGRTHERSGLRGPGPSRRAGGRAIGRDGHRLARPGLPRPHGAPMSSSSTSTRIRAGTTLAAAGSAYQEARGPSAPTPSEAYGVYEARRSRTPPPGATRAPVGDQGVARGRSILGTMTRRSATSGSTGPSGSPPGHVEPSAPSRRWQPVGQAVGGLGSAL